MSKQVKNLMIASIKERIGSNRDLVFVDISRMRSLECNRLRNELSDQGYHLLTVKNAVAKCALREVGFSVPDDSLSGPITILYGATDIVELSKAATRLISNSQVIRLCGGLTANEALNASDVESLSKSPSRQELLGELCTLMISPGRRLSACINYCSGAIASQIKRISESD